MFTAAYFGEWGWADNREEAVIPATADGYPGTATKLVKKSQDTGPAIEVLAQNGRCVTTGPFTNVQNFRNYPGYAALNAAEKAALPDPVDRCLSRNKEFLKTITVKTIQENINKLLLMKPNGKVGADFTYQIERDFHNSIHSGIAGDMYESGSPADPIFWSHHAMLDNLWAAWQELKPENAVAYNRKKWNYRYPFDGVSDKLNEGLDQKEFGPGEEIKDIPQGTKRDFMRTDKMVFLDHLDDLENGVQYDVRWTVEQLLAERGMFRTFQ